MPTPEYIASATPSGNPTTSFTITIPTVQVDDVLILSCINGGSTADPSVTDNDTGGNTWSKMVGATALVRSAQVFWKRATSATSAKTITASGFTNSSSGTLDVYRGCVGFGSPFQREEANNHLSGIETRSGILTTVRNTMVCMSVMSAGQNSASAVTCTSPGNLAQRSEKISTGGLDTTCAHWSAPKSTAGLTGLFTWSQTDAASFTAVYALKPPPPLITFPDQLGWKIFYADESTNIGTTLSDWDNAPDTGVVAIMEVFAKGIGRTMDRYTIDSHAGFDFYWMVPEFTEYTHKNVTHVLDALEVGGGPARLIPPNAHTKEGQTVSDELFNQILAQCTPPPYGSFPP